MATPQNFVKVTDHLSLNNGTTSVDLKAGQVNVIKAKAGEHYRIIIQKEGVSKLLDNVIVKRAGADLQLKYADGTQLTLSNYYNEATGEAGCDLALPGRDGIDYNLSEKNTLGTDLGDDTTLVYAHGDHDILMNMAPGDSGLHNTLAEISGNELSYIPRPPILDQLAGINPWWVATGLAVIGGGVGAGVALGGSDSSRVVEATPVSQSNTVSGRVQGGPVIAGNDLSVDLYQGDGITLIGTSLVSAAGTFSIEIGSYIGAFIAKVRNGGAAADYIDETTGLATNLTANLMAVGVVNTSPVTLNINALTTAAAIKAGANYSGASTTVVTETMANQSNEAVASAFGLTDLLGTSIILTIDITGQANVLFTSSDHSNAEHYGAVLSGLSGMDFANNGNTQATINSLVEGLTIVGSKGVLSPTFQVLANTAHGALGAALNALSAVAQANTANATTTPLTTYVAAGVNGVTASNLAEINSALNSVAITGTQALTTAQIQSIVTDYNAILASADGVAGNTIPAITTAQYTNIGVTSAPTGNALGLLGNVIDGLAKTAVSTELQVQALADAANAVMTGAAGGTPPTLAQLELLGITGVTAGNLVAVQQAIAAIVDNGTDVNTQALLQAVATAGELAGSNAVTAIQDAAINNTATTSGLSVSTFVTAGVTGVTLSNLAAINSALDSVLVDGGKTSTTDLIQAIVTDYNAILSSADSLAGNTIPAITTAQYTNIGVTSAPTGNALGLLGNVIDGLAATAVSTELQVQALADAANAVMTGANGGIAPTLAQLGLLGITGVTAGNLVSVQQAIAATADNGTGVNTQALLQGVATAHENAVSNAITAIQNAAINNTAATSELSVSTYITAGVTGVTSSNLAAINSALDSVLVDGGKTSTTDLIQAIVTDYNAILSSADSLAGNTNPAINTAQYTTIGVTSAPTSNALGLLGNVIDGLATTAVSTELQVQALADAANAVMIGADGGTPPTLAQLGLLGITGVTAGNLVAVQQAIAATADNGTGVNTQVLLQAVATAHENTVSNAITAIQNAAINNTAATSGLSVSTFVTAGVTGVTSSNLAAINSALDSVLVDGSKTSSTALIQAIVTDYNAILSSADSLAGNTNPAITTAQYTTIGVTSAPTGNALGLLGNVIDGLATTAVSTELQVQALADAANTVMTGANGGIAPTLAQIGLLGITGVTAGNLVAVQQAIADTLDNGSGVNTQVLLQAVATAGELASSNALNAVQENLNAIQDAVTAIQDKAIHNTAATSGLSLETYVIAGVTGVTLIRQQKTGQKS
ncbi:MAG: hypothetical protein RLZZ66_2567 [Pseudomonadota bacterium]|jgi:hypothetical protein